MPVTLKQEQDLLTKPDETQEFVEVESGPERHEMAGISAYIEAKEKVAKKQAALKKALKPLTDLVASTDTSLRLTADGLVSTDSTVIFYEDNDEVLVGAKGNSTEVVDKEKILELLGRDNFMALVKFSITDLREYLTKAQFDECTKTARTGKRSLKVL